MENNFEHKVETGDGFEDERASYTQTLLRLPFESDHGS
jgi:hypothetical protein